MNKRPIVITVIGYILGILWGLYFSFSIAFFYITIASIYVIINKLKNTENRKFKLISLKRYKRYLKLFLNQKALISIIIISIISNLIFMIQNLKYQNLYYEKEIKLTGIITSDRIEKEYADMYEFKISELEKNNKLKNKKIYIRVKKDQKLEYGELVEIKGNFIKLDTQRNENGFDYSKYLKTLKIYGVLKAEKIKILGKNKVNIIFLLSHKIKNDIKGKIFRIFQQEEANVVCGILLGDSSEISEDIKENFKISNFTHILAISGMHISYIIIGINFIFSRIIGKRNTKIFIIFLLTIYMFITGFSQSIVRAGVMGMIVVLGDLLYRRTDTWTSMSISLLILLIYNPYNLISIGVQLSYFGTIGIILFHKNVLNFLEKININKRKKHIKIPKSISNILSQFKKIMSVTISAQLLILPVLIANFNIFGIYFILTNLLVSIIIGPILVLSIITIFIAYINLSVSKIIGLTVNILIKSLIFISNFSKLPFSKIYIATPNFFQIIIFYISIFIIHLCLKLKYEKKLNQSQKRLINLFHLMKFKFKTNKKRNLAFINVLFIVIVFINLVPKNLEIDFVDVGQGDCAFIVTPRNKTILIDGGGSESETFDVGKKTLIPFILGKGYTKIDYIIISHFDQDHVGGLLSVMEELRVDTAIISKQGEDSENYRKFSEIVKKKKIKVQAVGQGDRLKIEKDLYFDILWPNKSKLISENILNNNSIVCKLHYNDFSMLFTGDIEEIAEKQILKEYENNFQVLKSDVLKVAHHGSKTSSREEFIDAVKPKFALIGVGENNKFGHPSEKALERLTKMRCKNL